jgi:hypothetical protein
MIVTMMMPPTYLTVLGAKAVNSSDAATAVDDDSFIRLGDDHITHLLLMRRSKGKNGRKTRCARYLVRQEGVNFLSTFSCHTYEKRIARYSG